MNPMFPLDNNRSNPVSSEQQSHSNRQRPTQQTIRDAASNQMSHLQNQSPFYTNSPNQPSRQWDQNYSCPSSQTMQVHFNIYPTQADSRRDAPPFHVMPPIDIPTRFDSTNKERVFTNYSQSDTLPPLRNLAATLPPFLSNNSFSRLPTTSSDPLTCEREISHMRENSRSGSRKRTNDQAFEQPHTTKTKSQKTSQRSDETENTSRTKERTSHISFVDETNIVTMQNLTQSECAENSIIQATSELQKLANEQEATLHQLKSDILTHISPADQQKLGLEAKPPIRVEMDKVFKSTIDITERSIMIMNVLKNIIILNRNTQK